MKLIIPQKMAGEVGQRVRDIVPDAEIVCVADDGTADGEIGDADALLRGMSRHAFEQTLQRASSLRWVHTVTAGVDGLPLAELGQRGIILTNSAGAHGVAISEFVLAMMLAQAKQLRELTTLTPSNAWSRGKDFELVELHGQTLCVVGLGSIGQEVAMRAAAFGMHVIGSKRRPGPVEGVERVVGEEDWRELLPEADFIAICVPLTDATRGMVDEAAFQQMKRGAYLINIARGQIVVTGALLDALHSGHLAGAALDVLPQEPLPADHPLWQAPNVWITPHISGTSNHTHARSMGYFYDNLKRFVAGEPFQNVVDHDAGY